MQDAEDAEEELAWEADIRLEPGENPGSPGPGAPRGLGLACWGVDGRGSALGGAAGATGAVCGPPGGAAGSI